MTDRRWNFYEGPNEVSADYALAVLWQNSDMSRTVASIAKRDEPEVREVVRDADGDEWKRDDEGWWGRSNGEGAHVNWSLLCHTFGPLTLVSTPTPPPAPDQPEIVGWYQQRKPGKLDKNYVTANAEQAAEWRRIGKYPVIELYATLPKD